MNPLPATVFFFRTFTGEKDEYHKIGRLLFDAVAIGLIVFKL